MHTQALLKLNKLFSLCLLGAGVLSACSYSVSVNDNLVYTPESLFTDYQIADQNLARCLQQTISDRSVTKATDLTRLNCSNAGIKSVVGLEVFTALEELNLSGNQVHEVDAIARMPQMRVLILSDNPLLSAAPLLALLHLHTLDLAENPGLACNDIEQLEKNWAGLNNTLIKPQQCR